jgi:hypothetical protein
MQTQPDRGSYSRSVVTLRGSFQTNGASAPTVIRDGKAALIKSVVRESAGLFTVTFNDHGMLPSRLITERADLSVAAGGSAAQANVVDESYSQGDRTVQIVTSSAGAAADTTGLRVNFELVGSVSSAGTDAA